MTSSLVGSEMCIRDRPKASRLAYFRSNCRAPSDRFPPPSTAKTCRKGTVSYTHLTLPTICSV
eukprot:5817940-Prorocentrum_lima.AAC.1